MEKKLILEELFRMRELMGMNVLSETRYSISRNLLMEGGKTVDELIGLGPKSVDNLTKNGVDFANDLTKLSDEFTARGIKSFADLSDVVAKKEGIAVADLTDDMIEAYIKNDDVLYKSILAKASAAAADQVDQLIKNVNVSTIFSKNPDQLKSYNVFISTPPSARNIDVLIDGVNDSIDELDKIIDDLNAAGSTVPDELKELYEQMVSRKTDLTNYKNKGTTPPTPKPKNDFPEPEDLVTDDVAEEIVSNPQSTINEIFDAIVKNRKLRKSVAPGLNAEDFDGIRARLIAKYGDVSMETLLKNYDLVKADAITMLKNAQKVIDDAEKGIVKEGTDPNKYRTLKNIGNFLYDNKLTRACVGTEGKNKNTVGFTGVAYKLPLCALGVLFISDVLSWVMTPKTERDFIGCNMLGTLGLCGTFTEYGFCEKSCSESTEPILQKVYDDTDEDFAKWVKDNDGTDPSKDTDGRFYTDKTGNKQYVDHDSSKRIFVNRGGGITPKPSKCKWTTDADAIAAVKATFKGAADKDITVDLANCKVTYYNPILKTSTTYTPDTI
jgi:hypothetical protein